MNLLDGDVFHLDCGRDVYLEECYIARTALGWLEGSEEVIRNEVIPALPERVRKQFPGDYYGVFIKPISEEHLPAYVFMVSLHCHETVRTDPDPDDICSGLVVCWLGDSIGENLQELIAKEIRSVDWDQYAVNFNI